MGGAPSDLDDEALTRIDPARIDDAVARVLTLKERLGLFERPYVEESEERTSPTAGSRSLVRRAAARSSVLLTNDGTLPLSRRGRILLSGPYATSTDLLGAWTQSFGAEAGSIADELRDRGIDVEVLPGTDFLADDVSGLDDVVAAAAHCDVAVVVVGEPSALSGEAASRSDLRLPGRQTELIQAVAGTGIPCVVIVMAGRPIVVGDWVDLPSSVVAAWHGGTEAAAAIVDVLLGDEDPAGRLPMSWPRSVGQVPVYYAHENTGRPAATGGTLSAEAEDVGLLGPDNVHEKYTSKYLDLDLGPQFAFGHGSGYATFDRSTPRVSTATVSLAVLDAGATVRLEIDVTNTAARSGDDVVQVYVQDLVASVAQPVRRLIAFERRTLEPGESATLAFAIGRDELRFWDAVSARFVVEPGLFRLHVGGTLASTKSVDLRVGGE